MSTTIETVGTMTVEQLRTLVEEVVRDQLIDLLGDPDEGLELRPAIRDRLLAQQARVRRGERGTPMDEIASRLGL